MKIIYPVIFIFFAALSLQAQTIFRTQEGHIMFIANNDYEAVKAESHQLSVFLDYSSKKVMGTLDLKTLNTDILEFNNYIKQTELPLIIEFSGSIPEEDFLSKPHEPFNFNWPVTLTFQGKQLKTIFEATLTHINKDVLSSCLLSANGDLPTLDTGLKRLIPGLGDVIEIQFAQLILRKE